MYRVVFLLAPGLHLLDLAGPAQAFSTANDLGYGYDLYYVAHHNLAFDVMVLLQTVEIVLLHLEKSGSAN